MTQQVLWVGGPMPVMNELLDAKAVRGRRGKKGRRNSLYNTIKQEWTETVKGHAESCKLQPVGPSHFTFYVQEKNKRRDPDGFCFGCMKLIMDALVKHGYLPNDGWKHVLGFTFYWDVSELPGVTVTIRPDRVLTREEAVGG